MAKKTIRDYDLLSLHISSMEDEKTNYRQIMKEKSIQVPHKDYDAETKLNLKQKVTFTIIIEMINSGRSGVFFIDGPGGTGKIFLYRTLLVQMRLRRLIALATTTSGAATAILPEGRTTHSQFILPLNPNYIDFCDFSKTKWNCRVIMKGIYS